MEERNFSIKTQMRVLDALSKEPRTKYELSKELEISYPIINSVLAFLEEDEKIKHIEKDKYAKIQSSKTFDRWRD